MDRQNIRLSELIDLKNPQAVLEEIKYVLKLISNNIKTDLIEKIYSDVILLFKGEFPGFLASNTKYHDLEHTISVALAVSRLIHGAFMGGKEFDDENILTAIVAALFHDVGLIQESHDTTGTGAKYTIGHEERSTDFLKNYLLSNNLPSESAEKGSKFIMCTILDMDPGDIDFDSDEIKTLGFMVGSADILAQMADRLYLEKLLLLYQEFEEAKVPEIGSPLELLQKTNDFYYSRAKNRLLNGLGGVCRYMHDHFKHRWDIDRDLYDVAISNSINYIGMLSNKCGDCYTCYLENLRRGGITKNFLSSIPNS
jgi:HD superfamily phosphodiesterase